MLELAASVWRPTAARWLGWRTRMAVLLSMAIVILGVFVVSVGGLLMWSLYSGGTIGVGPSGHVTLGNYVRAFTDPLFVGALWTTLRLSTGATAASLALGLPVAYWMVRTRSRRTRAAVIILVAIPFMTSLIVRLYSLTLVLGNTGLINRALQELGVIGPNEFLRLIRNEMSVGIGLTYFVLPFVIFTLAGVVRRLDYQLEEAAQNLGADEVVTFFRVALPLLLPGVVAAGTLAFVLAGTAFVTPLILGGGAVEMIANSIYDQAMSVQSMPMAATLSAVALVFTFACLYVGQQLVRERRLAKAT
ncbi:MAG: ABC transporter permease [Arenicellales bacterium]